MAKKVLETYIDDLDGSDAATAVEFAIDGRHFVIDLSEENADEFRGLLSPYVAVATPTLTPRGLKTGPRTRSMKSVGNGKAKRGVYKGREYDTVIVRKWADANGFDIPPRGRLAFEVLDAYFKVDHS